MPSLSVASIMKDEACFVPSYLAGLRAVGVDPSDIHVLDTGSTDGTPELLRDQGVRVRSALGPFVSFAAARTSLLEQVPPGWVLLLDADEEPTLAMMTDCLARSKAEPATGAVALDVTRYNFFATGAFYTTTETKLVWFAGQAPRYVGAVAERLVDPAGSPVPVVDRLDGVLNHFGHTRPVAQRHAKERTYLRLIEAEIAAGSLRARGLTRAAALIRRAWGDRAGAAALLDSLLAEAPGNAQVRLLEAHLARSDPDRFPAVVEFARAWEAGAGDPVAGNLYAVSLLCSGRPAEAARVLRALFTDHPDLPHLGLNLGLALAYGGERLAGLEALASAAQVNPAFLRSAPDADLRYEPWLPLMSETIPAYHGLARHIQDAATLGRCGEDR
jgi:hypothetical protein